MAVFRNVRKLVQKSSNYRKGYSAVNKAVYGSAVAYKLAKKIANSVTKSKTTTRPRRGLPTSNAGIGASNFTVTLNKNRPKHAKGTWKYTQTNVLSATFGAGLQAFDEITALGTVSQLTVSTGTGYNALEGQVALKLLNPNYLNTGSSYLPGASVPTTDQWVISGMKSVCEFTSWCDVAQEVNIYYFVCRSGTQDSPKTIWERGYQQQGSGIGVMTTLTSPLYLGTAGYGKVNEPFANPMDVGRYLSQVYRVIKHTKVMLNSGDTHTVTLNIRANKLIKQSSLDLANSDGEISIPGLTVYMVTTVRGQVVRDTAAVRPTYSGTAVGYICRNSYTCHPVDCPNANRETAIHAYNVPIATAFANQTLIDVGDEPDVFKQI